MTIPRPPEEDLPAEPDPIVVVETDPDGRDYDARLATWIAQLQRAPGVPFPRAHGYGPAQLQRGFRRVTVVAPDGRLRLVVPIGAEEEVDLGPGLLAMFVQAAARATFVVERLVGGDVSPSGLDRLLANRGIETLSNRPWANRGEVLGDVLGGFRVGREECVGRWATVRVGGRALLASLHAPRSRYADVARAFVVFRDGLVGAIDDVFAAAAEG